ncbi:MAG: hypothetical protein CMC50_00170 [Flavobacteriaceae bacterium]|nr:hypothetical protein [Flavobacteriaceae bacterium]|tara:strand:+ start:1195 stop:1503 length:309 start_codon:yes stop_codon:yes gene_type:complete
MDIDLNKIEKTCGTKPENQEFFIVGNDPNYVFENDPNYETLRLFDIEGNVINVNSWFECANYVNGGWSMNYSSFSGDLFFFGVTSSLLAFYLIIKYFRLQKK